MLNIGQKLTSCRLDRTKTQAELAKKSGIPQARISDIERGKRDMTVSTLLVLCSALDVLPAQFFSKNNVTTEAFSRERLERIAKTVWKPSLAKSGTERMTAKLLGQIVPLNHQRHLSQKKIYSSWNSLRKMYAEGEIKTLVERVRGEEGRRNAKKSY